MSPFLILFIVLTLGYILYYVGVMAMDVRAMSKKDAPTVETIPTEEQAEGNEEEEEEQAPRTVVQDPNGGFHYTIPEKPSKTEEKEEDIAEAQETPAESVEEKTDEHPQEEKQPEQTEEAPQEEASTEDAEESDVQPAEEPTSEPDGTDAGTEKEAEDEEEEEYPNIVISTFKDEDPNDKPEPEPFDANTAFDPDLARKPFGITAIIEPQTDPVVEQRTAKIKSSMIDINTKGNLFAPNAFSAAILNDAEQNIVRHDEYTRF